MTATERPMTVHGHLFTNDARIALTIRVSLELTAERAIWTLSLVAGGEPVTYTSVDVSVVSFTRELIARMVDADAQNAAAVYPPKEKRCPFCYDLGNRGFPHEGTIQHEPCPHCGGTGLQQSARSAHGGHRTRWRRCRRVLLLPGLAATWLELSAHQC